MKLYKVTCTFDFVIAAASYNLASRGAKHYASDAFRDMSSDCLEFELNTYIEGSVDGWDGSIEPYGDSNGKTTSEIMLESTSD